MLKITKDTVEKITIQTSNKSIGNITLITENFDLGQGRAIILNDGDCWSYYWSSMGKCTIQNFLKAKSLNYLVGKFLINSQFQAQIDFDKVNSKLKSEILEKRKSKEYSKEESRECWDDIVFFQRYNSVELANDNYYYDFVIKVMGMDYKYPQIENPSIERLTVIINYIKEALIPNKT